MKRIWDIISLDRQDYDEAIERFLAQMKTDAYFCPMENQTHITSNFLGKSTKIMAGYTYLLIDDDDVYKILFDEIKKHTNRLIKPDGKIDDVVVCKIVQAAVFNYLGFGRPMDEKRTYVYCSAARNNQEVSIKKFRKNGLSMCLERATLAHNFFKLLGYDSNLIASEIRLNGYQGLHTYNIVTINGEKYFFDLICSKINEGKMPNPLIARLKDVQQMQGDTIEFTTQSGKLQHINYMNYPCCNDSPLTTD